MVYHIEMFDQALKKLELEDVARILDEISPKLGEGFFDPVTTTIHHTDVPFYNGYSLLEIKSGDTTNPIQRHLIYKPGDATLLDYTNVPIYNMNQSVPINLLGVTVLDYIRFFLKFVKGKSGFFHLTESVDDIAWKEEPPMQARKAIADMITPLTLRTIGKGDKDGIFFCSGNMMFKNGLFKSDIIVDPKGFITIENEHLLIEDMPVYDDVLKG